MSIPFLDSAEGVWTDANKNKNHKANNNDNNNTNNNRRKVFLAGFDIPAGFHPSGAAPCARNFFSNLKSGMLLPSGCEEVTSLKSEKQEKINVDSPEK